MRDETARVPDRVFMDGTQKAEYGNLIQGVRDVDQRAKINDAAQMMAEQIDRSRVSLEELHGHGPASVGWSIDYQTHRSTATVTMPYDEDCPVCQTLAKIEKLREDSDG